jgi:hypothetical protein
MNRKSVLKRITAGLLLLGVVLSLSPFIISLKPESNARSSASLPRIDVSKMEVGELLFHPYEEGSYNGFKFSILLYKNRSGALQAFRVPTKNGNQVGMPDLKWWKPFYPCKIFGTKEINSKLVFKCLDRDLPSEWWGKKWQWDTEGKSLDPDIDDIPTITGSVQDGYFILYKRS